MNQARTVRLPVHMFRELNHVLRAKSYIEAQFANGKEANADDIAHFLEMPVREVQNVLGLGEHATSLDALLDQDPFASLMDFLPALQEDRPDMQAEQQELGLLVHEWLGRLSAKQRTIIVRRFGLDEQDVCTLEQLAVEIGVTRERIRQIQQEALVSLKQMLTARGIDRDACL
jgi:RNA polymerase nonessential primary-like sigma factor